jgi:Uri superfamily endonuclease
MADVTTYILLLYLPLDTQLAIGSLGEANLPAGFYTYVDHVEGAARLAARLKHHLNPAEPPRTHIDYLQQVAPVEEIWLASASESRRESWAELLVSVPGSIALVEEFGLTDDELDGEIETFLFYFDVRPSLEDFVIGVRHVFPQDVVLRAFARQDKDAENGASD